MKTNKQQTAEQRIISEYYATTSSGVGGMRDKSGFDRTVKGLKRRFGNWLDVEGMDVIDLGSGTGELCSLLEASGAKTVVGVNLCQDEIGFAEQYSGATFVCSDVGEYMASRNTSSIDVVFAMNILEHLDKNCLIGLLENIHRVLRPGGVIVAMVPNAVSPFGGMTRYWDFTHQQAFTPSSVMQLSRLCGFDEVGFKECGPVVHGLKSGVRYLLWMGIRLAIKGYLLVETASGKHGIYTSDMLFRMRKSRESHHV